MSKTWTWGAAVIGLVIGVVSCHFTDAPPDHAMARVRTTRAELSPNADVDKAAVRRVQYFIAAPNGPVSQHPSTPHAVPQRTVEPHWSHANRTPQPFVHVANAPAANAPAEMALPQETWGPSMPMTVAGDCGACNSGCPSCGPSCGPIGDSHCGVRGCTGSERTRVLRSVQRQECGAEAQWCDAQPLTWEVFGPGEYIGPVRTTDVSVYRIRAGDQLSLTYLLSRDEVPEYRLQIGDTISIQSTVDSKVNRSVEIMPDGRIPTYGLGYIHIAGRTLPELVKLLNDLYEDEGFSKPNISVIGTSVNTRLKDIQQTVDARQSLTGGTGVDVTVAADGRVNLVGLSSGQVCCQGLSVEELQHEINARYREVVPGLTVYVAIDQLAPKTVTVMGDVANAGAFNLQGPTRISQALALAGGPQLSGNTREIVVVRHTPNWGTIATKVDLRGFLLGKRPAPADDLWVRDQDIIVVPRGPVYRATDLIQQVFTNGAYAMFPELGGLGNNTFGFGTVLGN